jgi:hypothetical protein
LPEIDTDDESQRDSVSQVTDGPEIIDLTGDSVTGEPDIIDLTGDTDVEEDLIQSLEFPGYDDETDDETEPGGSKFVPGKGNPSQFGGKQPLPESPTDRPLSPCPYFDEQDDSESVHYHVDRNRFRNSYLGTSNDSSDLDSPDTHGNGVPEYDQPIFRDSEQASPSINPGSEETNKIQRVDPRYRHVSQQERDSDAYKANRHCSGGKFQGGVDIFFRREDKDRQQNLERHKARERVQNEVEAQVRFDEFMRQLSQRKLQTEVGTAAPKASAGMLQPLSQSPGPAEVRRPSLISGLDANATTGNTLSGASKAKADSRRGAVKKCSGRKPLPHPQSTPPQPTNSYRSVQARGRHTRGNAQQEDIDLHRALQLSLQEAHPGTGSSRPGLSRTVEHHIQSRKRIYSSEDDEDTSDYESAAKKPKGSSSTTHTGNKKKRAYSSDVESSDSEVPPPKRFKTVKPVSKAAAKTPARARKRVYDTDDESADDESPPTKKLKATKPTKKSAGKSPAKPRNGPWVDEEHHAITTLVQERRQQEQSFDMKPLRDMNLWNLISEQLAQHYGIMRGGTACKNYWNRFGRVRSGFEERGALPRGQKRSLVTSAQGTKKKATAAKPKKSRPSKHTDEDETEESEVEVADWNYPPNNYREDDDDDEDPKHGVRQMNLAGFPEGFIDAYED